MYMLNKWVKSAIEEKGDIGHPPAIFVHWLPSYMANSQFYEVCLIRI